MVSIRAAQVRDATAIAHVHVQGWLTTYEGIVPKEYLASLSEADRIPLWQDWLTRDISVFVAELQGTPIGFAGGGPVREPFAPYDAELYTLYVLKEAQRCGAGTALLEAVAQSLVHRGYKKLLVWVLEQNPAVAFYEQAGARHLTSKQIEIGGAPLTELALGWADLTTATRNSPPSFRPGG